MNQGVFLYVVSGMVALAAAVIGFFAWRYYQQRRRAHLRSQFGPEYDRTVLETRNRARAEAELARREKQVRKFKLRPLSLADQQRFTSAWQGAQARFVDDPPGATAEAHRLVHDLMLAWGYPAGDFNELTAYVSVDHPWVMQDYREAHAIAVRNEGGQGGTEDLRQAIIHYRAMFGDLLGMRKVA